MTHAEVLLEYMNELFSSQQACDVVLIAGNGEVLQAHKVVLAAYSLYFGRKFTSRAINLEWIDLSGVDGSSLAALIRFFYTGQLSIANQPDGVRRLLSVARRLQVSRAVNICKNALQRFSHNTDVQHSKSSDDRIQSVDSGILTSRNNSTGLEILSSDHGDYATVLRDSLNGSGLNLNATEFSSKNEVFMTRQVLCNYATSLTVAKRALNGSHSVKNDDMLTDDISCESSIAVDTFETGLKVKEEVTDEIDSKLGVFCRVVISADDQRNGNATLIGNTVRAERKLSSSAHKLYGRKNENSVKKVKKRESLTQLRKRINHQNAPGNKRLVVSGEKALQKELKMLPKRTKRSEKILKISAMSNNKKNLKKIDFVKSETKLSGTQCRLSSKWVCVEAGCSQSFPAHPQLKQHMLSDHPNVMYHCKICRYHSPVQRMMEKHSRTRHRNDSEKTCETCNRTFSSKYHYRAHQRVKHDVIDPTLKIFQCPVGGCSFIGVHASALKLHEIKHQEEKTFCCDTCGKRLKTSSNLSKHMAKIHLGIRPYICDQCGESFGDKSDLKAHHVRRHSKSKLFTCNVCGNGFSDKGNFRGHMWSQHRIVLSSKQKVHHCTVCEYATDRKARYVQHMDSHNNRRRYACTQCDKRFTALSTLKGHIQWKHEQRELKCTYCNHVTRAISQLREHIRVMHTHRDVKPYQCAYCQYRCRTSGNTRKHVAQCHKDLPIKWIKVCDKYADRSTSCADSLDGTVSGTYDRERENHLRTDGLNKDYYVP